MKRFLISAATLIALTTTAQSDIACSRTGCWETGKRIISNGGVYRGLEHRRPDKNGVLRRVYPLEVDATSAPRAHSDSYVPRASR
jgi:hypothetical protein